MGSFIKSFTTHGALHDDLLIETCGPRVQKNTFLQMTSFLKRIFHNFLLGNGYSEILNIDITILKLDFFRFYKHFSHKRGRYDEAPNFTTWCDVGGMTQSLIEPPLHSEPGHSWCTDPVCVWDPSECSSHTSWKFPSSCPYPSCACSRRWKAWVACVTFVLWVT